ncbi:tryptophan synthase alpha chain [Alicyclobacillus cellulosilyticus]|uniref:Tryptophan synthase alpha chain n=1 Tax=Alicyclobacillus cellulosilyticus TaxID=1003997 RepID=A0A917NKL1_9BACL|nr:tryptophan synthase subunit alpha [Alicyclobacillus cellulosilyticus]GGJ07486.1 tryptophan synthase alpha chain [Alicyclobacillus cellulosilyticus]
MDRIARAFRRPEKRAALIPFLTAGDPSFDASFALFREVIAAGADLVEIGIPYSDPLADGPVIQAASLRSLRAGFSLPKAFELTAALRRDTEAGLVLFTYVNPLFQYTPERFFRDAKAAGADGVIVPDLPVEESDPVRAVADRYGVALIPLIAPTSGEERVARVCAAARGFVYCVSSLGVTGERAHVSARVRELVAMARRYTSLPLCVGFGVSAPDHVQSIAEYADGVIVGSALIRRLERAMADWPEDEAAWAEAVRSFVRELNFPLLRQAGM